MPEDRELLEQRRVARLGGVAHLHAIVEQGHAIEGEHQRRGGQSPSEAETGDGAGFVVIIRNPHVK